LVNRGKEKNEVKKKLFEIAEKITFLSAVILRFVKSSYAEKQKRHRMVPSLLK